MRVVKERQNQRFSSIARVVYVVVGIENDSDEFLFQKPKKDLEVVAVDG